MTPAIRRISSRRRQVHGNAAATRRHAGDDFRSGKAANLRLHSRREKCGQAALARAPSASAANAPRPVKPRATCIRRKARCRTLAVRAARHSAQPDGLERARELDRQFGANPNLAALPLYCTPFSIKDIFDTKDMRSTGGADVACGMDAAPADSTIVAQLRAKARSFSPRPT